MLRWMFADSHFGKPSPIGSIQSSFDDFQLAERLNFVNQTKEHFQSIELALPKNELMSLSRVHRILQGGFSTGNITGCSNLQHHQSHVESGSFIELLPSEGPCNSIRSNFNVQESSIMNFYSVFKCLILNKYFLGMWMFLRKAWHLEMDDPRKVIHYVNVGITLSVVSLFYYMRPLYDGVGGTAVWAVMTVVVVFEYTVGATITKCLNRAIGTCLARFLVVGVHWLATKSWTNLSLL
ncbi:hypothetical protein ACH5RR_041794 [Cinchona calisaya]|uniref:Uncharacterized protein n=1 Tax=Cinchona calisaya TaxID=153742 RepID=A0ABD2XUJ6_9GENT